MEHLIYAQNNPLNGNVDFFNSTAIDPMSYLYPILLLCFLLAILLILTTVTRKQLNIPASNAFGYSLITLFLSLTMGIPYFFLGYGVVGFCLLLLPFALIPCLIQNIVNTFKLPGKKDSVENLSRERDKIFQLLEAGKINAQEAKELLNAIYEPIEQNKTQTDYQTTPPMPPFQEATTEGRS